MKSVQVHTDGRDGQIGQDFGRTLFKDAPYLCVTFSFCHTFLNSISGLGNIEFKVQMQQMHVK